MSWLPTNQSDDFTVFTDSPELVRGLGCWSTSQTVDFVNGKKARVQPAKCFLGEMLSVTVRAEESFRQPLLNPPDSKDYKLATPFLKSEPASDSLSTLRDVA